MDSLSLVKPPNKWRCRIIHVAWECLGWDSEVANLCYWGWPTVDLCWPEKNVMLIREIWGNTRKLFLSSVVFWLQSFQYPQKHSIHCLFQPSKRIVGRAKEPSSKIAVQLCFTTCNGVVSTWLLIHGMRYGHGSVATNGGRTSTRLLFWFKRGVQQVLT